MPRQSICAHPSERAAALPPGLLHLPGQEGLCEDAPSPSAVSHRREGWPSLKGQPLLTDLGLSALPPTRQCQNQMAHAVGAPTSAWAAWGAAGAWVCKAAQTAGPAHSPLSYKGHSQPGVMQLLLWPAAAFPTEGILPPVKTVQTQVMRFPNNIG